MTENQSTVKTRFPIRRLIANGATELPCINCKEVKPLASFPELDRGERICEDCIHEVRAARGARTRNKKRNTGICITCPKPALPGQKQCEDCTAKRRVQQTRRRDAIKDSGICCLCDEPLYDKNHCLKHSIECRVYALVRRRKLKWRAVVACGSKCVDCGLEATFDTTACFDFHHRDPTQKEHSLGRLLIASTDWTIISKELEKTDLICSNCHRKRHQLEDVTILLEQARQVGIEVPLELLTEA